MINLQYPSENGFSEFLSLHGGQSNASTTAEHTTYYFDVEHGALDEALDRYVHMYIGAVGSCLHSVYMEVYDVYIHLYVHTHVNMRPTICTYVHTIGIRYLNTYIHLYFKQSVLLGTCMYLCT